MRVFEFVFVLTFFLFSNSFSNYDQKTDKNWSLLRRITFSVFILELIFLNQFVCYNIVREMGENIFSFFHVFLNVFFFK